VIPFLNFSLHLGNSFHSSRLYGFFCELRRRKVWRVAGGYSVVGWLIIQFATTVFPALALPAWTARLVILLVLAGFPTALILAWAFDVSSAGIALLHRRTQFKDTSRGPAGRVLYASRIVHGPQDRGDNDDCVATVRNAGRGILSHLGWTVVINRYGRVL
jgi:hypothetical protein